MGTLSARVWCSALTGGEERAEGEVIKGYVGKYRGCESGQEPK